MVSSWPAKSSTDFDLTGPMKPSFAKLESPAPLRTSTVRRMKKSFASCRMRLPLTSRRGAEETGSKVCGCLRPRTA